MAEKRHVLNHLEIMEKKGEFAARENLLLEREPIILAIIQGDLDKFNKILNEHSDEYYIDEVLARCLGAPTLDASVAMMTSAIEHRLDASSKEAADGMPGILLMFLKYYFPYVLTPPPYDYDDYAQYNSAYVDTVFAQLTPLIKAVNFYLHVDYSKYLDEHFDHFLGYAIYSRDIDRIYIYMKLGANPRAGLIKDYITDKMVPYDVYLDRLINECEYPYDYLQISNYKVLKQLINKCVSEKTMLKTTGGAQENAAMALLPFE
jgi:hypothetical protein